MVKSLTSHGRDIALRLRHSLIGRPFVRHVGALTLANGVVAVLSFLQGILVARWLGPELYGVAALVMSVPSLVYTFFDARSAEASVKYLSEFHARGERERAAAMCRLGYFIDFGIALVSFSAVLLIAPWASRTIVRRPELSWLMMLYAAAFLPRSLRGTSYAVMAVQGFFPTIALIDTVTTAIQVGLVVGFVLLGWGVVGVVWGNTLAMTIAGLLYGVPAWRLMERSWGRIGWSKSWSLLKGYRREIFRFLVYNDLTALLGLLTKQLDLVLLGYFRGPMEVGWYKLAKNVTGSVAYLVSPLQSVAYPRFAALAGLEQQRLLKKKVRDFALKVGIPMGLVALVGGEAALSLIPTMVGAQYTPAVGAARFLLIGFSLWLAFFWLRPLFLARAAVKEWSLFIFLLSMLTLSGWVLVVPFYGYMGMSVWWTVCVTLFFTGVGLWHFLRLKP